jgi:hypothetical protein
VNKLSAIQILSSISKEEAREMNRKIREAEKKIRKRTHNPGKAYQPPKRLWKKRDH